MKKIPWIIMICILLAVLFKFSILNGENGRPMTNSTQSLYESLTIVDKFEKTAYGDENEWKIHYDKHYKVEGESKCFSFREINESFDIGDTLYVYVNGTLFVRDGLIILKKTECD